MQYLFNLEEIFFFFLFCRPKAKTPPQDMLLKLEKEKTFMDQSQESSMFVFKLGLTKLKCCLLMNGLVSESSEVLPPTTFVLFSGHPWN